MNAIQKIYARWFWMTKFALVENNEPFFQVAFQQCVRMERLYSDIFADVRVETARQFVRLDNGQWATKFVVS